MNKKNHFTVSPDELLLYYNIIHKNKYDYSKFVYTGMNNKSIIICPEHGEFEMTANAHKKGQGCPKCAIAARSEKRTMTNEEFIRRAKEVHGDRYDYSKTMYIKAKDKITIICPKHGEFEQTAHQHLTGNGCPLCYNDRRHEIRLKPAEDIIASFHDTHGNKYDYSKVEYVNYSTKVCIICPEHGEFWQSPAQHINGQGCPKCGTLQRAEKRKIGTEEFVRRARDVHGYKYNYDKTNYNTAEEDVIITCPKHGDFMQRPHTHLDGCGCPQCAHEIKTSGGEHEIRDFISSIYKGKIVTSYRKAFRGKMEIDIYLPELNVGFEYDGLFWHNERNQDEPAKYHLNKTNMCAEHGIQLYHIFEDEWIYKKEIVKSMIAVRVGTVSERVFARNCEIREVSKQEATEFLDRNHLQGNVGSFVRYGLFHNGELVSIMTFGRLRKITGRSNEEGSYELLRFCNKMNMTVVGGASRLLKHFEKTVKPKMLLTYADRRWSNGNLYRTLGFNFLHDSTPNYFYVRGDRRENRFNYRKDILVSEGYDPNKSEHEIMLERKIYRIYDCGSKVYQKTYNHE